MRLRGQVENEHNAVKFEVIDPPSTPRVPSAPNRPLLLLGVLLLGIGGGAGAGWALGQLRSCFATAGKLENAFQLPVIGTVSHVTTETSRRIDKQRFKLFALAGGALCGLALVLLAIEFIQRGMVA